MESTDSIVVDSETWGAIELFEVISSRYFELGNEGSIPPSWEVNGKDGKNAGEQLVLLNDHLAPMGMVGTLEGSNPPLLSISGLPSGQVVLKNWQQALVWLAMSALLTIIGAEWVERYGHGSNPLGLGTWGQSALYFTAPMLASVLTASQIRKTIASRMGVESGHIIPIVLPISTWWPFGIIGTLGQRRSDLVPVPNRRSLGVIETIVPLSLFLLGSILTLIGLSLTPESPPELDEPPVVFQTNLLVGIFSEAWLGHGLGLRLQWLHPTGIAGIGLAIIGWGLMLPIPGFPGDRAMHCIFGPSKMRDGNFQTSIFIAFLGILVFVFATSDYSPWIFLAAIAVWQRFSPDSIPQPIVLDEYTGLDERDGVRLTAIAIIILIAGFPGATPSLEMEGYDAGLSTDAWPVELEFVGEQALEIELELSPRGVKPVSGWIQFRVEGPLYGAWSISNSCSEITNICEFEDVTQSNTGSLGVILHPPGGGGLPHLLRIFVDVQGKETEHTIDLVGSVPPTGIGGPGSPLWHSSNEAGISTICTSVEVSGGGANITSENPYWDFSNSTELVEGSNEVCMTGHHGAMSFTSRYDQLGRAFGPGIAIVQGNATTGYWNLPIEGSGAYLPVSDGEWELPNNFVNSGDILFHADSGHPFCPSSGVVREVDTDATNWSVSMEDYSAIRLSGGFEGNGYLEMGPSGWLTVCDESTILEAYTLMEGLDVIFPSTIAIEEGRAYFQVLNREEMSLPVTVEWFGNSPDSGIWNISKPDSIDSGETGTFEIESTGDLPLERSIWITADPSGVIVHLSARCPLGGC